MKSILTVIGTRPEAIKLAPVLSAIHSSKFLMSKVCITRQHTDLLDPFLLDLKITADYQVESDEKGRSLSQNAAHILKQCALILDKSKPDLVLVQGDTTTAFAAALAAFYARIPVAHVEAGLRTGCLDSPWPEEGHRCLIDQLTTYFFAPTQQAKDTLLSEGTSSKKVWIVGNTSIDAIRLAREASHLPPAAKPRMIVVTAHRRENHGNPMKEICLALQEISQQFPNVRILFLLHPNPAVREAVTDMLSGIPRIDLVEPMNHTSFIKLLDESLFVVTDSGGIQEEVSFIGKPVIVVRDTTERIEGVHTGTARLVGTKASNIVACCKELLENKEILNRMSKVHFPYGDGYAAERIINILERELS